MFKLKNLNVIRIVAEEKDRDALIDAGFKLVDDKAEPNFSAMKVDELKAYAEGKGIDLGQATKKDDIITAINAVLKAPTVPPEK